MMASCRRKESPCQEGYRNQTRGTGPRTMPRQRGVHWTVWSVYISSYLYRDLLIDALYFRDPSDSHGISTMFLSLSLSPSLSLVALVSYPPRVYPLSPRAYLFLSRVGGISIGVRHLDFTRSIMQLFQMG